MFEFRYVRGHVEVFLNGVFQFSADNMTEARRELKQAEQEKGERYEQR